MRRTAALIVGGGPAGSAAAIGLARRGVRPLLIERDATPGDALCGGFLSWATIDRLRTLDIDTAALGAHQIGRLGLFAGKRQAEARLPAPAAGLSRGALDAALLAKAAAIGVEIERGVMARRWDRGRIMLDGDQEVIADAVLLATGKHELRGLARPRGEAIGLRFRLAPSAALTRLLAGRIELHLFRGGYAGLLLQEDGAANLCLAAHGSRLDEASGRPERLLAAIAEELPAFAERVGAVSAIGPVQAIANIPYGWRVEQAEPGLFRLGDQAGVIPSLAGEGIAIALASGLAAARAITRGESSCAYQAKMAARLKRPMTIAGVISRAAGRSLGARALIGATHLAPGLAGIIARLTRIPD